MATTDGIRALFKTKYKDNNQNIHFHPMDLRKIEDDGYLMRIIHEVDHDLKQAVDMLWTILVWRNSVGASDINENNINMEYVKHAILFPYGRDIEGCRMLNVRGRIHIKGQRNIDQLKNIIIYWFDRVEREANGKQISLFFDMEGCGLANMDMEFVKFLMALKNYYPGLVNYTMIYQMPWILSTSFKVIKSMMPAKVAAKMKFLTKDTLKEYIAPEQLFPTWDGGNEFVFKFEPEVKTENDYQNISLSNKFNSCIEINNLPFADQESQQYSSGELLRITPSEILFKRLDNEITGRFTIHNSEDSNVFFKIRSTAPEKFTVRPTSGIISKGVSTDVTICVLSSCLKVINSRDQFMVAVIKLNHIQNPTQEKMKEVWKNTPKNCITEHRLQCKIPDKIVGNEVTQQNLIEDKLEKLMITIAKLQINQESMRKQSKWLNIYQIMTLILTLAITLLGFLIYIREPSSSDTEHSDCVYVRSHNGPY